jgi:sugar porter (SP) family MFS transporter
MNDRKVFLWSLVVGLGGFLFGFDTAVISGAERSIQTYWNLNTVEHGLTISIALVGTIVGALFGSIPSDALGRKKTLAIIAALYLVSSIGTAFSTNWIAFLCFRFVGGWGVGASSVTAPVYISEIAPPQNRGKLVALFQFNIVLGILISYFSNYLIGSTTENAWRWMLGVQAIPALLFLILIRTIPETPRWLFLKKGDRAAAESVLKIINPTGYLKDLENISLDQAQRQSSDGNEAPSFLQKKYRFPAMLALLFALFNQLSGINAIIYYAPRIFEMTGLGERSSLLSTVGIGVINLLFTMLAMRFIDKVGRRTLMLAGSFGLIATLGLVSASFYTGGGNGYLIASYLFLYIAFFAFSQGAVIWVFISEIFPNEVRAKGQTLGSATHWIMAALIAFFFPALATWIGGGGIFLFFTIMMVLQLLFVWKMMPETKGKSLEQIERTVVVH